MTDEATVKSLALVVARLEERVNAMSRSSGTADAHRVEELAARVDELAEAVEQLAAARGGGSAAAPSWFAVTNPDDAAQMLVDLVPWVYQVVAPQIRQGSGQVGGDPFMPCWMWHPERVEALLALQQPWIEAYQGEGGRATAAVEWQQRWLPGWQDDAGKATKRGPCELPGHVVVKYGPAGQRPQQTTQELIAARLHVAPAYARWWLQHRRGVDAGPTPGLPLS